MRGRGEVRALSFCLQRTVGAAFGAWGISANIELTSAPDWSHAPPLPPSSASASRFPFKDFPTISR